MRSMVRPMVRGVIGSPYGGSSYHDGISYSAETGRVVLKAPGAAPTITTLTSAFTFTCGNQSMFMGPAGLLVQSVTNTPRVEYDAAGNCLGLLMEASRTNLCLQSQDFATTWTLTNCTISANATTGPDGTASADKIVENSAAGTSHVPNQSISFTSGTTYTISVWLKAAERTVAVVQVGAAPFGAAQGALIDLQTGAVSVSSGTPTVAATQYPNGWWRVSVTKAATSTAAANVSVFLHNGTGVTYDGNGTSGLFVYGAQVEVGAFASSYIPTTTGSVARTADSCIRTLGSEFSATAGTIVLAGRTSGGQDAGAGQTIIEIDDTTSNERHTITRAATADTVRYNVFDGGVLQSTMESATLGNSTAFKSSFAWALNDIAQSTNGGTVTTDTSATLPTVTQLVLAGPGGNGNSFMNGHIRRFDYYPTRLSNAFLQSASA